jgi:mRNA interferase HigB
VIGTDLVETYFVRHAGNRGIRAARAQYDAWRAIVEASQWKTPADVKSAHPKASILKGSRAVFNIKGNDYRLIALIQYRAGVVMIRFFGSHEEYDEVDAETV